MVKAMKSRAKHSPECKERARAHKEKMRAFVKKYPGWCWACRATGVVTWTENQSPIGSGETWLMDMSEPCDACVGKGKCPRCGKPVAPAVVLDKHNKEITEEWGDNENRRCPHCGWRWGQNKDDHAPPEFECECYTKELEEED